MSSRKTAKQTDLSPAKKRLFTLLTVALPIVLLLLFEGLLRLSGYGGDMRLFVPAPEEVSGYLMVNREVGRRYFFMQSTLPKPPKDLLLKKKPDNGFRIFVLGGSTAAGFPYGNNVMFSRILQHHLTNLFPERRIEVINTAMAAVNSYTLLDFVDEILARQPDGLLLYAGHNEFYGAMGVDSMESLGQHRTVIRIYLSLKRFKIFVLLRDAIGMARRAFSRHLRGESDGDPTATLMARIVAEQTIPYQSPLFRRGEEQFRANLKALFRKVNEAGVALIASELVSNLSDQAPFVSVPYDTFPPADRVFRLAQKLENRGDYQDAGIAYTWAKDLDALRFRAPESFNRIIHQAAADFDFPVVAMKQAYARVSRNGLTGNRLILEHLHPNVRGYFLMAEAFCSTMRREGWIAENWPDRSVQNLLPSWGITALDTAYADLSIHYLKGGWPFQPPGAANTSLQSYQRATRVESLAVKILVQPDFSLELGHLELAEYYQQQELWQLAYDEYKALFYTIPYETLFYRRAAEMLLRMGDYDGIVPVLSRSNTYTETAFAHKWVGQSLLMSGQLDTAIVHLERARALSGEPDEQLLYNLGRAYLKTGDIEKSRSLVLELGESRFAGQLGAEMASTLKQAESFIEKAQTHLQNNELESALTLLLQSLKIQQTATANKWIAQILLRQKRVEQAIPYLEKTRKLIPDDAQLLYNLSAAYLTTGRLAAAKEVFGRLERVDPNHPDLQVLRDRLTGTGDKQSMSGHAE